MVRSHPRERLQREFTHPLMDLSILRTGKINNLSISRGLQVILHSQDQRISPLPQVPGTIIGERKEEPQGNTPTMDPHPLKPTISRQRCPRQLRAQCIIPVHPQRMDIDRATPPQMTGTEAKERKRHRMHSWCRNTVTSPRSRADSHRTRVGITLPWSMIKTGLTLTPPTVGEGMWDSNRITSST